MRTFVCTVFWAVCLQINVLLPPSWAMFILLLMAAAQDVKELNR